MVILDPGLSAFIESMFFTRLVNSDSTLYDLRLMGMEVTKLQASKSKFLKATIKRLAIYVYSHNLQTSLSHKA